MKDIIATGFIVAVCLALAIVVIACVRAGQSPRPAPPEIGLEQRLGDKVLPGISDASVVVLPTGERVLVMFGSEGRGFCCLLPPLPAGLKLAGPERMP